MSDLIDRHALLEECLNHYEVGNIEQNCTMDWICKTVRNFPAAPRWVRCEEEMPKEYGEYLGHANGDVMFLKFDPDQRDEWKWTAYDAEGSFSLRMCDITHWMPLPEPPTGTERSET